MSPGPDGQPGIRSQFATLTVLVPPEPPRILQGDFIFTDENKELELVCVSIGGKPATAVNIVKNQFHSRQLCVHVFFYLLSCFS